MRIGIHTGKVVGGVVGIKRPRYLIWGNQTVVANKMESRGIPGKIQISEPTYTRLGKCQEVLEERGNIDIGQDQPMKTYILEVKYSSKKLRKFY